MPDSLTAYRQKRDFGATPEPRGTTTAEPGRALAFVVQKHAARSLHYDFRLELNGTLKSWAVPKGPSLDPAQKRMAVQVEDHPLAYGGFEGVIPPNQYGAGTVIVWDRGTWQPVGDPVEGWRTGKLKFRLDGAKLHGLWVLVKMHGRTNERQQPWLLIKERDEFARPAGDYSVVDALPASVLSPSAPKPARKAAAANSATANDAPAKSPPENGAAKKSASKKRAAAKSTSQTNASVKQAKASATHGGTKPRKAATDLAKPKKSEAAVPEGAVAAPLPASLEPELATLVSSPPEGGDWAYEVKFDGYRILARIGEGDEVRLVTRNHNDWTAKLKPIAAEIAALNIPSGWLDGEIVVLNADGVSDFNALQNAFDAGGEQIRYFVFDLPYYGGYDLRAVPLQDRRALLANLLDDASAKVRFSQDFHADTSDVLHNACRLHLEGVIGKRLGSAYVSQRSPDWIKLKCMLRQEFVIGGYTEPQGARVGLGALLLGIHDERGHLRYAGNVGTGFDTKTLNALRRQLAAIEVPQTPFFEKPRDAKGSWVEPVLVAEVSFAEWTKDGRVRQAVFHGLRADKPADAIGRERAVPAPKANAAPALPPSVHITNPQRVIDPSTQRTKHDLVDYYLQAARRILPHLAQRPVALVRAPAGIQGPHFFQKHSGSLKIEDIRELPPSMDPGHPPLLEIGSFTALISAAQMNVVEFHTWNATARAIEKPDRMVFDLDPGEGVEWPLMIEVAKLTKGVLEELGLRSFLKTSGGKGLHVVVPLAPRKGWDEVMDFSRAVVNWLAVLVPNQLVTKSGANNRVGKIFVDYLRNGSGATTAAAFSARARPGLGVSVPCRWDELDALTGGDQWNIATVHERLESAEDPWAGYSALRQTLTAAIKSLRSQASRKKNEPSQPEERPK